MLDEMQRQDLGGSSRGRESSSPARCPVFLPSSIVDFPSLVDSNTEVNMFYGNSYFLGSEVACPGGWLDSFTSGNFST